MASAALGHVERAEAALGIDPESRCHGSGVEQGHIRFARYFVSGHRYAWSFDTPRG
jgi:hypothetical protein